VTAFFDRYRVADNRLETQHALVKRASLVEVEVERPICENPLCFISTTPVQVFGESENIVSDQHRDCGVVRLKSSAALRIPPTASG